MEIDIRRYCLLAPSNEQRVGHFAGFPPIAGKEVPPRVRLPAARILLMTGSNSDGVVLYRYSAAREYAGDTWHANLEEALDQVNFEFGAANGEWKDIPAGFDEHEFALQELDRLNSRS